MENLYTEQMIAKYTKAQLTEIAEANGIEVPSEAKNKDIIALIVEKGCPIPTKETGTTDIVTPNDVPDAELARQKALEYMNEKVKIVLRKPPHLTYTEDKYANVTVNGLRYQVPYDVEATVPRFVKEAIDNSERQRAILSRARNAAISKTEIAAKEGAID